MHSLYQFVTVPHACGYLADREAQIAYTIVGFATAGDYEKKLLLGWRRFGFAFFHPQCETCTSCHSLRIVVDRFAPNRSQRRAWKANQDLTLIIGKPSVSPEKLALYDRYHSFQSQFKGWPGHDPKEAASYSESFVDNPFPTQEWSYYLEDRLVGVGYVDSLSVGLSAIYFFYDPDERDRSLGTYNVLRVIEEARKRKMPHVYLGYFVAGCPSLEYKANFIPNEVVHADGIWREFRSVDKDKS